MHTVTMLIGNVNWSLTYKEPAAADIAYRDLLKAVPGEMLELEDDFGIKVAIGPDTKIEAIQRADAAKTFEGQALMGLFQARARGLLEAMAQKDPELTFLSGPHLANGSGIIRPRE